jgi:hypothetical protein|tara:strand:+ start:354 stop:626 length:273 start_codon:yes stop_codon:yes gene_type:complete
MKIFIIKSHDGSLLGKDLAWVDGANANLIFTAQHRDIALNQLIELNAKDIHLRAEIAECEADKKGRPALVLDAAVMPSEAPANADQVSAA